MTRDDFVTAIATKANITKKDTRMFLGIIQDVTYENIKSDGGVPLMEGLKVTCYEKPSRRYRDPRTGEVGMTQAKMVPKVKIGLKLKQAAEA